MKQQQRLFATVLFLCLFTPHPLLYGQEAVKDFTVPSATDDSLIRLSDHPGKVVLINWWRTNCAWSQRESPRLVALQQKYGSQGLVILGVSDDTADSVAGIPAYLRKHGIAWPVGLNDQGEFKREIVGNDSSRGATPGNYLVTRSGRITYLGLDRSQKEGQKLESAVVAALAEKAPFTPPLRPRELTPAPSFSLMDLQGKKVSLADFAGKPLVVNFFTASSCDWAGGVLSRLQQQYGGRGLQFVGVNLFDSDAAIQQCLLKHGVKYPVLRGTQAIQQAWIGSSSNWATFFVTSEGKVFKRITDSIENGLEETVFSKYAHYLVALED